MAAVVDRFGAPVEAGGRDSAALTGRALRVATGSTSATVTWIGWLVFVSLTLATVSGLMLFGVMRQDEGLLLVYPWLIAHGEMPYRDIWMQYPPATFVLLAAAIKAGIPGLVAERGLSVGSRLVYGLIVNRYLTDSWLRFSWLGIPISLSLLLFAPDADIRAYPWVVGMPFLLLGLMAARNRPVLSALMFFVAGTFRFEFGVAGLVCLTSLCGLAALQGHPWRRQLIAAVALAVGLIAFFAGLQVLTGAAIQDIFIDPVLWISPGRSLPLLPPNYGAAGIPLAVLTLASPALMAIIALIHRRPYLAAVNLAVLTLLQHFLSRPDWLNLRVVAASVVPWTIVTLVDFMKYENPGLGGESRHGRGPAVTKLAGWGLSGISLMVGAWYSFLVLAFAVLYCPLSPLAPRSLVDYSPRIVHGGGGTTLAWTSAEARDDRQVIDYLDHRGNQRQTVFVAPEKIQYAIYNMTILYYSLEQQPASKYLEMDPGLETRASVQREIVRELRGCTWVILWKGGFWHEENASQRAGSLLLSSYIHAHYTSVLENSTYEVLERSIHVHANAG